MGTNCALLIVDLFLYCYESQFMAGHCGRYRIVVGLQLPLQSVPITTKVVSSNPTHGEVYLIQHYVIKFVSDFWQVCGFLHQ
jgi:hypothetical protein